jgi:hypothetical protein
MIATIALDYHPLTNTSSVAGAASFSPLGLQRQRGAELTEELQKTTSGSKVPLILGKLIFQGAYPPKHDPYPKICLSPIITTTATNMTHVYTANSNLQSTLYKC